MKSYPWLVALIGSIALSVCSTAAMAATYSDPLSPPLPSSAPPPIMEKQMPQAASKPTPPPLLAAPVKPRADLVAKVVWVNGNLFTATGPDKAVRKLVAGSEIYLHDTLETDKTAQAQIVFTDNALMAFRPETKLYINQYSYHPETKEKSAGKYMMDLIKGGFRAVTGLIAKANPNDYSINTPVATIGVRGTTFVTQNLVDKIGRVIDTMVNVERVTVPGSDKKCDPGDKACNEERLALLRVGEPDVSVTSIKSGKTVLLGVGKGLNSFAHINEGGDVISAKEAPASFIKATASTPNVVQTTISQAPATPISAVGGSTGGGGSSGSSGGSTTITSPSGNSSTVPVGGSFNICPS